MGSPYPAIIHSALASYDGSSSVIAAAARHYWKLDEPKGSTVVKSATQGLGSDGTIVGAVEMGVSGLVANGGKTAARLMGGHIAIPDSDVLETNLLSVSAWFSSDSDLAPVAAALWAKLDETSGTAAANSGYLGTAGTYSGSFFLDQVAALPGVTGKSVRFDGLNGIVSFPHHVDLRLNASFTIAFWASVKSYIDPFPGILRKGDFTTANGYDVVRASSVNEMRFRRNNVSYAITGANAKSGFNHFAYVYNESAQTLTPYLNGVAQASITGVTFPDSIGTDALEIGRGSTQHGDNWIDEVLIYPSALTQQQVQDVVSGFPIHVPSGQWRGGIGRENIWGLGWQSFSNGWTFDIWIGGNRHICELANSPVLKGQKYFVVGDYNGGQMRLLINGVVVATTTIAGNIDDAAVNTPLNIGIFHGGIWKGVIDEVLVHHFPITNGDAGLLNRMLELYQAGISQDAVAYCPPKPTSARERIFYIRPEGGSEARYLLHAPPSRVVMSEEGFGTPPLEYVIDRAPFQHGTSVRSFHLNPRVIQLAVMQNFRSREEYWNGRAELTSMLRPIALTHAPESLGTVLEGLPVDIPALSPARQGKLLCYLGNGVKRQIDVLLESGPGFAPPQGGWREWSFTEVLRFIAHDPTWYDPTVRVLSMNLTGFSELKFPATFPVTFTGTGAAGTVEYRGDWPAAPVIIVWGEFSSVKVENLTTGKQVTLNAVVPDFYAAVFDFSNKRVLRSDGVNLLGSLADDSDLTDFLLQPDPIAPGGINEISLTAENFSPSSDSPFVVWFDRYMAI